jgi:hypothetical protein
MIGHRRATRLYPQNFKMGTPPENITVIADGRRLSVAVPAIFTFHDHFKIQAPAAYRVNVIGFNAKRKNENGLTIRADDLNPKYAMDRDNRLFRVELYRKGRFCGMVIAQKVEP